MIKLVTLMVSLIESFMHEILTRNINPDNGNEIQDPSKGGQYSFL